VISCVAAQILDEQDEGDGEFGLMEAGEEEEGCADDCEDDEEGGEPPKKKSKTDGEE